MNPNIALLAQQPRGKAFRSRLIPYDADIWRWLSAGETYKSIALKLRERGLSVSITAVQEYVSVRARRHHFSSHLPGPLPINANSSIDTLEQPITPPHNLPRASQTTRKDVAHKEFVFLPSETKVESIQDEDLTLNDPTKY